MPRRAFRLASLLALTPAFVALNVNLAAVSGGSSAGAPPLISGPRSAEASVAVQLSLDELVDASSFVVVATATEHRSQWEELAGARRIVTYTRLTIDRPIAGAPGKEIWVRTLGGVVGKIGQQVSGDAQLSIGAQALLFLTQTDSAVVVSGMSQGHYPVVEESPPPAAAKPQRALAKRLAGSPDAGAVLPRRGPTISAREVLIGATLDAAIGAINQAWNAHHASK